MPTPPATIRGGMSGRVVAVAWRADEAGVQCRPRYDSWERPDRLTPARRRRRNPPGIAQAKGPRGQSATLESDAPGLAGIVHRRGSSSQVIDPARLFMNSENRFAHCRPDLLARSCRVNNKDDKYLLLLRRYRGFDRARAPAFADAASSSTFMPPQ